VRKSRKYLTVDEVEAVRAEVAAGAMQMDVAAKYGIHKTTVSRIIGSSRRAPRLTLAQQEAIVKDFLAGWTITEIAERNNTSDTSVSRVLDRSVYQKKGGFIPYIPKESNG
jgi:DNA-binding transcriptional regulator LsrR (DeoR family)